MGVLLHPSRNMFRRSLRRSAADQSGLNHLPPSSAIAGRTSATESFAIENGNHHLSSRITGAFFRLSSHAARVPLFLPTLRRFPRNPSNFLNDFDRPLSSFSPTDFASLH